MTQIRVRVSYFKHVTCKETQRGLDNKDNKSRAKNEKHYQFLFTTFGVLVAVHRSLRMNPEVVNYYPQSCLIEGSS